MAYREVTGYSSQQFNAAEGRGKHGGYGIVCVSCIEFIWAESWIRLDAYLSLNKASINF